MRDFCEYEYLLLTRHNTMKSDTGMENPVDLPKTRCAKLYPFYCVST